MMMDNSSMWILSKNELGFITMPKGKDIIHLCFNNLMINFTVADFDTFRYIVKKVFAEQGPISFPDGKQRILLHSPYDGINFSFDSYELNQLVNVLDEAFYMQQIYSYLKPE